MSLQWVYFQMQAFLAGTPSHRTIYRQACADRIKYVMLSTFLGVSPLTAAGRQQDGTSTYGSTDAAEVSSRGQL